MTSTDEQGLRRFFEERLTPIADHLKASGRELFPLAASDGASSWYIDCDQDAPEFFEVEAEHLERDLRAIWDRQGLPQLAALAGDFVQLAEEVRLDDEQSAEVSPYIYVMY